MPGVKQAAQTIVPVCEASAAQCNMWRQTGQCGTGEREPDHDLHCEQLVEAGASGFCECCGGINVPYTCDHSAFTCFDVCRKKVSEMLPVPERLDVVSDSNALRKKTHWLGAPARGAAKDHSRIVAVQMLLVALGVLILLCSMRLISKRRKQSLQALA